MYIYLLRCPITNEVKYIGRTKHELKSRLQRHISTNYKSNAMKAYWIMKLKEKNLIPIIELVEVINNEDANLKEKYWINYYLDKKIQLFNINENVYR